MKPRKYRPPKCVGCGNLLKDVYENECWIYSYDEKRGIYKGDLVDIEIRCPDCNASLKEIFPEGTCNYQAQISA